MKIFKHILLAGLVATLSGCGDPNTIAKVGSYHISALGDNSPISGGASEGEYSSNMFGAHGYFRSYLNSDIARVPIKFEITFTDQTGKVLGSSTFMYDVFLQKAEVIDILNNKSMKNFKVTFTSSEDGVRPATGKIDSTVCYSLNYNDRLVEIEEPGHKAKWCKSF